MKIYLKFYKSRVGNARVSLDKPVIIQDLLGNIKSELSRKHAEPLSEFSELYFWDLGKLASGQIQVGDKLYIVTSNDMYVGTIDVHIKDFQGGIGDAIGWARQFKKAWDNPIGFKEIRHSAITPQLREKVDDAITTGTQVAPSFKLLRGEIDSEALTSSVRIAEPPLSEKNPIQSDIPEDKPLRAPSGPSQDVATGVANPISPKDSKLTILQSQILLVSMADHHSEREHESLVERFFEYLGYEYPTDIKYRVGHIDILINANSPNSMVVEVKRDWTLSKSDADVVNQAYRYATNKGSRFVVITNGDYYAFYDRLRGLSITENFDFAIKVSELSNQQQQLLLKYRKTSLT